MLQIMASGVQVLYQAKCLHLHLLFIILGVFFHWASPKKVKVWKTEVRRGQSCEMSILLHGARSLDQILPKEN